MDEFHIMYRALVIVGDGHMLSYKYSCYPYASNFTESLLVYVMRGLDPLTR